LISCIRIALKRLITQTICGDKHPFNAATLKPEWEQLLQQSLQLNSEQALSLEPQLAEQLHTALLQFQEKLATVGKPAIVLVSSAIRGHLAQLFRYSIPGLHFLSYQELPDNKEVNIIDSIGAY
jgi:flagellar biosynthesis protein FlhA